MAEASGRAELQAGVTAATVSRQITGPNAEPCPDPALAGDVSRHVASLQAQPTSENLGQVQDDIRRHGLETVLRAITPAPASQAGPSTLLAAPATLPAAISAGSTGPVEKGLLAPEPSGDGLQRGTWQNCIGNLVVQPLRLFKPATLPELSTIVQHATDQQYKVKAVGSGHSFTDVACGPDFLVDTHGLNRALPLETDVLRDEVSAGTLFEIEAGITVCSLNEALWDAGLGLINMGGYDGQTVMGVVSTSTHGSGITFGPLSSFALSFSLVVAGGQVLRIEPADGITDPARWGAKHPDVQLLQDDETFYACQVGLGCMGVVYSLIIQAQPRYWLKEERTLSTWSRVKQDLLAGQVLADNRHYEVLVNPYPTSAGGDRTCLVTRRNIVDEPDEPSELLPNRNPLFELFARLPGTGPLLLDLINTAPDLVPAIIDSGLQSIARDTVDRSYRVFNVGAANDVPAYGSEIGFALNGETHLSAVERILEIAADTQATGKAYLTSPFSLRFVKSSPAFLSMMYGADTCMVEFPMLDNTVGGKELLRRIECEMYAFGGRPHWGLLNFLCGGDLIGSMYPQFDTWLSVNRRLDPDGTFDNAFTDRCGISRRVFVRD